jgi:hypothetical protein
VNAWGSRRLAGIPNIQAVYRGGGSLSKQTCLNLIAYLLQANGISRHGGFAVTRR